jgi:hypothetical protein
MSVLSDTRAFVGLPIFCTGSRLRIHKTRRHMKTRRQEDKQQLMRQAADN